MGLDIEFGMGLDKWLITGLVIELGISWSRNFIRE